MKKTTYVVCLAIFGLIPLASCLEVEDLAPAFDAESVKVTVQGRWSIEKTSSQLCRENTCNTSEVAGNSQGYFEFRADSAFLQRTGANKNLTMQDAYRASYQTGGVILLSNANRAEKFEVVELRSKRIVLQSTFTGRDPAAIFTDTYYLYK